MEFVVFLL